MTELLVLIGLLAPNVLGVLALAMLLPYLDRLRLLQWREHLWRVVGMHLSWALWLGWTAYEGLLGGALDGYHAFAILGAGMWLSVSRPTWRRGPPSYTQTVPGALQDDTLPRPEAQP